MSSDGAADPAEAVYAFVRTVPRGRVVTYGQIADCLDSVRLTARQVGTILSMCPADAPWHRVVGAGGSTPISKRSPAAALLQRRLLEAEGVAFLGNGRVDMARAQWVDAPWRDE
jgi:methylated-DNA-protein-cysteine methyltransferase-like protein